MQDDTERAMLGRARQLIGVKMHHLSSRRYGGEDQAEDGDPANRDAWTRLWGVTHVHSNSNRKPMGQITERLSTSMLASETQT